MKTSADCKLALLKKVYDTLYYSTETFSENSLGEDLAYLLGAIVTDSHCNWDEDRDIVALLKENFPASHDIWDYVEVEPVPDSPSIDE